MLPSWGQHTKNNHCLRPQKASAVVCHDQHTQQTAHTNKSDTKYIIQMLSSRCHCTMRCNQDTLPTPTQLLDTTPGRGITLPAARNTTSHPLQQSHKPSNKSAGSSLQQKPLTASNVSLQLLWQYCLRRQAASTLTGLTPT